MSCTEPRLTGLKIAYNNELHRIRVDLSTFQYTDLVLLVQRTFGLTPSDAFVIQYRDIDNDVLNITSQAEYAEAVKEYLTTKPNACLRFQAIPRTSVPTEEQLTAPILKVLEKLVEQLQNTIVLLKNEDWKGRYQKGMEIADQALQTTKEKVKMAAGNVKENVRDMEIDKFVTSASDGLKCATDALGAFAKDFVQEMKKVKVEFDKMKMSKVDETTTSNNEESNETEVTSKVLATTDVVETALPVAVPTAETSHGNSDGEWENIHQNTNKPEDVIVIEDVQPPNPMNEKVSLICEVFPACTVETALRLLEEANENVDIVMNRLAEQGY